MLTRKGIRVPFRGDGTDYVLQLSSISIISIIPLLPIIMFALRLPRIIVWQSSLGFTSTITALSSCESDLLHGGRIG